MSALLAREMSAFQERLGVNRNREVAGMVYTQAGMERAISKQVRWFEAAKILGLSGRQLRRLHYRYWT